jgi:hypothetical protein
VARKSLLNTSLISIVKDSLLISTDISNTKEIVFDILSKEDEEWSRYYLYVRNLDNFYYQRYESSMQRSGLVNLPRIKLQKDQHEWINNIKDWNNVFTKEDGIEFQLYNGSLMRFVGSNLDIDKSFVEGPFESISKYPENKPNHIASSEVKIIVNESFVKPISESISVEKMSDTDIEESSELINNQNEDLDEEDRTKDEKNMDPVFEQALDKIDNLVDNTPNEESEVEIVTQVEAEINNDSETMDDDTISELIVDETSIHDTPITPQDVENETSKSSLLDQIEDYVIPVSQKDEKQKIEKLTKINETNDLQFDKTQDIIVLESITINLSEKLKELGFDSIEKLSNAKIVELTKVNGIGRATARKIIQNAKVIIEGS